MFLNMFKSKIHRATVTEANLNYVGSITIDKVLLDKAGILPGEKVQIVNNNNGARLETYTIEGKENTGVVCLNGAAARLVQPGDKIIIIAYCLLDSKEAKEFKPNILILDDENKIIEELSEEVHGDIK